MFYYLQDHVANAILLITEDVFLINNIKAGILDCHVYTFTHRNETVDIIEQHNNSNYGIKLAGLGVSEFSLDEFPDVKRKQELVNIRKPAFELLLHCANTAIAKNQYGFNDQDIDYIQHALKSPTTIAEYAQVMKLNPEFAKEELSMIVDSVFQDRFRIFTVCNMWKEQINKCVTVEEVSNITPLIKDSFVFAGVPNV
jgi:hypothetical protein